jgi:D-amino-acid dehydrogenase
MHIAVIGAGIIGLTTCRALISQGHRVTLLERNSGAAQGASGNNGAQLSYAYVAPLAAPSILRELPELLLSKHAPLSISLSLRPALMKWSAQFLAHCTDAHVARTTAALLELAAASRAETDAWLSQLPDSRTVSHRRNGKLVVYSTANALALAEEQLALQRQFGVKQTLMKTAQCIEIEPTLSHSVSTIVGGIHTATDETADCAAVCAALLSQLNRAADFHFSPATSVERFIIERNQITGITVKSDREREETLSVDGAIVCAGASSAQLLAPLGLHLPILPLKGYSVDLPADAITRFPSLSITDTKRKVVFAPLVGADKSTLRVAGFAELNNHSPTIEPTRIASLLDSTHQLFGLKNGAREAAVPWMGHRPVTPHSRPYIGRTNTISNLFVNGGQGALGFTLAFGSARLVANIVSSKPTTLSRTLFAQHPLRIS